MARGMNMRKLIIDFFIDGPFFAARKFLKDDDYWRLRRILLRDDFWVRGVYWKFSSPNNASKYTARKKNLMSDYCTNKFSPGFG